MKKVFTHENRMIVYNMMNLLRGEGIGTLLKNEFAGGGVGDLPAFDTWPELWVDDAQLEQAQSILREAAHPDGGAGWFCRGCGESNDAAFGVCWNCGRGCETE